MKLRIIYRADGITTLEPALKARLPEETEDEHLERYYQEVIVKIPALAGLDFEDVEHTDLPTEADGVTKKHRYKWRGTLATGVKIDTSIVTPAEKRKIDEDALDVELVKAEPDAIAVIKLQRKLQKGYQ